MISGLNAAIGQYNSLGIFSDNGKYYKFALSAHVSSNPTYDSAHASFMHNGSSYNYGVAIGLAPGSGEEFGSATNGHVMNIDQGRIDSIFENGYFSTTGAANPDPDANEYIPGINDKDKWFAQVISHEIGHGLGLDHNSSSDIMSEHFGPTFHSSQIGDSYFSTSFGEITEDDANSAIDKMTELLGDNGAFLKNPFVLNNNNQ